MRLRHVQCHRGRAACFTQSRGSAVPLTEEEIQRYSRHILLPEVGGKGQQKIKDAKVFCVGAGGLGSPVTYYLAAAGVGRIGVADADSVDLSNLQRQIAHRTRDLGRPKVESCKETLTALNPNVRVDACSFKLGLDNISQIVAEYDIVVDGSDNFPTRFLVADACHFARKPLMYGAVFRFEGQATTFMPGDGNPCYRCLYPEPPPPDLVPSCREAGVLGVLPGLIGLIQATETLKVILGIGDLLVGQLLCYDALRMEFVKRKFRRDPDCLLCGRNPKITRLMAYDERTCTFRA